MGMRFALVAWACLLCSSTARGEEDLGSCCRRGDGHFDSARNCASLQRPRGADLCRRTELACCLRAETDRRCREGAELAESGSSCPSRLRSEAGALVEALCCDCCRLGRELGESGQGCHVPDGLEGRCGQVLHRCCSGVAPFAFSYATASQDYGRTSLPGRGGSCAEGNGGCGQRCEDGSHGPRCSCNQGYRLASDGRSCEADEESREAGAVSACGLGYALDDKGECSDINECEDESSVSSSEESICPENQICLNAPGSYECHCRNGFTWNAKTRSCMDIDECLLQMDTCITTQTCRNTPGSYRCIRTLSCGTGYYLDTENDTCMWTSA